MKIAFPTYRRAIVRIVRGLSSFRFSIQIETHLGFDWPSVRKIGMEAEKLGYHALYLCDHFLARTEELSKKPNLECWTTLSALSTITKQLRLGSLVTAVGFRYPSLLAKIASTLDVLSQGRLEFGIGAGWYEAEYLAYGYPFPKTAARIEQLAEAIQIVRKMWTEEKATFEGKHFTIKDAICSPKPIQKPKPTIWVGGTGRKVLGLIAAYADGWNSIGLTLDEYKMKLQTLTGECERTGRSPNTIRRSIYSGMIIGRDEAELQRVLRDLAPRYKKTEESYEGYQKRLRMDGRRFIGLPPEISEQINAYQKLGVGEVICFFPDLPGLDLMKILADEMLPSS